MNKMMNNINKMQMGMRKNKKGFTLVEVIVVLVILAILAAILIPSMIGWIDKANDKTALVEGRSVKLAAQTIASEVYGGNTSEATTPSQIKSLAEVSGTVASVVVSGGKVTSFKYTTKDGSRVVRLADGKLTVSDK
jgi:type IV pilus assembly protein PilA